MHYMNNEGITLKKRDCNSETLEFAIDFFIVFLFVVLQLGELQWSQSLSWDIFSVYQTHWSLFALLLWMKTITMNSISFVMNMETAYIAE